jgi:hypothetical protein
MDDALIGFNRIETVKRKAVAKHSLNKLIIVRSVLLVRQGMNIGKERKPIEPASLPHYDLIIMRQGKSNVILIHRKHHMQPNFLLV